MCNATNNDGSWLILVLFSMILIMLCHDGDLNNASRPRRSWCRHEHRLCGRECEQSKDCAWDASKTQRRTVIVDYFGFVKTAWLRPDRTWNCRNGKDTWRMCCQTLSNPCRRRRSVQIGYHQMPTSVNRHFPSTSTLTRNTSLPVD